MKTEHSLHVTMEFVYSNVIARSVNTFIPLGDETMNFSVVERGSLMETQPQHTLALPRRNKTDDHKCLSSGRQKCGSHKGKDPDCAEDVEVFPSQISEACPTPDWQYGNGSYHAKG